MNEQIAQLQGQVEDLEIENKRLKEENNILRQELAKLGTLGDSEKEKLLKKIIEQHPDCYNQIEFDEAFNNAAKHN